jgi:hypothetical protein
VQLKHRDTERGVGGSGANSSISGSSSITTSRGGQERKHCHTLSPSLSWSTMLNNASDSCVHQRTSRAVSGVRRYSATLSKGVSALESTTDGDEDDKSTGLIQNEISKQFHSVLLSRRTAAKPLVFTTSNDTPKLREMEKEYLRNALDRAVQASQMAPNHKRTEPFTFTRIWFGSQSATELAEICYEVTLLRQKSEPVARNKREKWSQIPAFLVTTVHNNQQADDYMLEDYGINDLYTQVEYSPPITVRQLEDVSTVHNHNNNRGNIPSLAV